MNAQHDEQDQTKATAQYQILYWYDIPTQVRARGVGGRVKVRLGPRFMEAVNKAAMAARITGDDAYRQGFHWSRPAERPGAAQELAEAIANELEAQFATIAWREIARRLKQQHGA